MMKTAIKFGQVHVKLQSGPAVPSAANRPMAKDELGPQPGWYSGCVHARRSGQAGKRGGGGTSGT